MTKEIMELVAKSLPAMQVDALRGELKKASEHEELYKKVDTLSKQIKALEEENRKLKALELSYDELNKRTTQQNLNLEKRERDLESAILKKELECVKQSKNDIFTLVSSVFRNTETRKTFSETSNCGYTTKTSSEEHL